MNKFFMFFALCFFFAQSPLVAMQAAAEPQETNSTNIEKMATDSADEVSQKESNRICTWFKKLTKASTAQTEVLKNNFFVPFMIGLIANIWHTEQQETPYLLNILGGLGAVANHALLTDATRDGWHPTFQWGKFPLFIEYTRTNCPLTPPSKALTIAGYLTGGITGYGIKKYALPLLVAGFNKGLLKIRN